MITMVTVRMMQVTVDDVIGVIAMWHGGVAAVGRVRVSGRFFGGPMAGSAGCGIGGADGDDVFVHMRAVGVVQMTAIEVVRVTVMGYGQMAAAGAVLMLVGLGVFGVRGTTARDERD